MMGRPRICGNRDLPAGLYAPCGYGCWRMKNPITNKLVSLQTKDKAEAIALYWQIKKELKDDIETGIINTFKFEKSDTLTTDLMATFRTDFLPNLISKKGKKLSDSQVGIDTGYLKNFESLDIFKVPLQVFGHIDNGPLTVRQYLSEYLHMPSTYNLRKGTLSKFFEYCIDLGLLQHNPCRAIKNKMKPKGTTYITDEHFSLLRGSLIEMYGEVYGRALDWIYLISARVNDCLVFKESQITDNELTYHDTKNDQEVIMKIDKPLRELIEWFREYKKRERIISDYLIVHPFMAHRLLSGRNIDGDRLYRYFVKARQALDLNQYSLDHIRPKALTDEAFINQKATNKGAHVTESMRRLYVKRALPVRVTNTIKPIK